MALSKSIPTSSNAVASYWNIIGVYSNRIEKFIEVQLAGYVDEATRRATNVDGSPKFRPLDNGTMRFTGPDYDALTRRAP